VMGTKPVTCASPQPPIFFDLTPNLSIFLSQIFDNVSDGFYNSKVNFPRSPNGTRDGIVDQTSRLCFPTAPLRKDEA